MQAKKISKHNVTLLFRRGKTAANVNAFIVMFLTESKVPRRGFCLDVTAANGMVCSSHLHLARKAGFDDTVVVTRSI
jgi:hypothetical protein